MIELFTYKIVTDQPMENIAKKVQQECDNFKFTLLITYNYH